MEFPEKLKTGHYHVKFGEKELGRYRTLSGAKRLSDANPGSAVFADDGTTVYPLSPVITANQPEDCKTSVAMLKAKMNLSSRKKVVLHFPFIVELTLDTEY